MNWSIQPCCAVPDAAWPGLRRGPLSAAPSPSSMAWAEDWQGGWNGGPSCLVARLPKRREEGKQRADPSRQKWPKNTLRLQVWPSQDIARKIYCDEMPGYVSGDAFPHEHVLSTINKSDTVSHTLVPLLLHVKINVEQEPGRGGTRTNYLERKKAFG